MRYLLAFLIVLAICLPCSAAAKYVNFDDTRARNLPSYGSTIDSPWITPSYAVSRIAKGDTIYIYAINDTYYADLCSFSDTYCDIVGVDEHGDSVIMGNRTAWGFNWLLSSAGVSVSVKNIRFRCRGGIICLSTNATTNKININDCIFDSVTVSVSSNSVLALGVGTNDNAALFASVTNCNFSNIIDGISLQRFSAISGDTISITARHITMRNVVNGFIYYAGSPTTAPVNGNHKIYVVDSILDADTMTVLENNDADGNYVNLTLTNCDTFGSVNNYKNKTGLLAGVNIAVTNGITTDPVWDSTPATSDTFWSATYSSLAVANHATDSTTLYLGAYQRYAAIVTASTTLQYRQPFAMRYRRLLWRQ